LSRTPRKAERLRKLFSEGFTGDRQHITDRMGTVHDLRFVIFDNDTRILFASTFDGDWDAYIDDFASKVPEEIDLLFHEVEDWPGIHESTQRILEVYVPRNTQMARNAIAKLELNRRGGKLEY
jgi:hypothetical protein